MALLAVGASVPELALLALLVLLLFGVVGLLWSYSNPLDQGRRGGQR
ncbi:hypothetical protein [Nocardia sp. NPDC127526]